MPPRHESSESLKEPIASLQEVSVKYNTKMGKVAALQAVSLDFMPSTSTAVLGRSGSGKSTLISVMSLLRTPTSGSLRIAGKETAELSAGKIRKLRSQNIGIVFQAFHLDTNLNATENIILPWYFGNPRGSKRKAVQQAKEIMELLEITNLANRKPNSMSGGQRQRVAIARALFNKPALFIADEPTGNLDEETANAVADLIFALPKELGTTVVVVTHDTEISKRADSFVQLSQGKLTDATA